MSPGLRQLQALVCAGLFLVAQLATSMHLGLEAHAVCPEHGEIIHGEVHARAASAAHVPSLGAVEDHDHDQCLLLVAPRDAEPTGRATVAEALTATVGFDAVVAPPHRHPPRATRRYGDAPKQSPPA